MKRLPADRRVGVLVLLLVALAFIHVTIPPLTFTGDEPRYASQGVGLYTTATLRPKRAAWDAFLKKSRLPETLYPYANLTDAPPALGPSLVFGAILRFGGLNTARWMNFLIGCIGIGALYCVLLRELDARSYRAAFLSIAFSSLSLPLVAYLRLLYPEVLLLTVISCALYTLATSRRYVTVLLAGILPFIHVRALGVSAALITLLVWETARSHKNRTLVAGILASYLVTIAIFLTTQKVLFGSILGTAFSAYTPALALFPTRFGMQLFDVRHGLLAYSPIYVIAIAGLLTGVLMRHRLCTYAAILLLIYFSTFMWGSASEAWTARYWVAAIPFLAIGMSFWLSRVSHWTQWLPVLPCAAVTIVNLALFCRQPTWFLENRRASISYAVLFKVTHMHLGLFLPIDEVPGGLPQFVAPIPSMIFFLFVVLLLFTLCSVLRSTKARVVIAIAAFGVMSIPFVEGFQRVLPGSQYAVSTSRSEDAFTIDLLHHPRNLSAVQLDAKLSLPWATSEFPRQFEVWCFTREGRFTTTLQPSRAIILLPGCPKATKIVVSALPRESGKKVFHALGVVTVMQPIAAEP